MKRRDETKERGGTTLALFFVLASFLHFFGARVADPDLWQHVRYGRLLCVDGVFPRSDDASYTAAGEPLVNHEWLAQCALAGAWEAGGATLLFAVKLVVGALTLVALRDTTLSIGRDLLPGGVLAPIVVAIGLVLAMAVVSPGMMFRPQLATILLLALQGALLARADRRLRRPREGSSPRVSWELAVQPLLLAAWTNLHGGFLVGLFQVGCWAGAVVLRHLVPEPSWTDEERPSRGEAALAAACAAACAAATLLNPYGPGLHAFLLRTLGVHEEISECEPVELLSFHFLRFKLLAAAALAALGLLWAARRSVAGARAVVDWRTPLLLVAGWAGFHHQRHTVLFAILAAPLVAATAEWLRQGAGRRPVVTPSRPVALALAAGIAAISSWQVANWSRVLARDGLEVRYDRAEFPVDAMAFLRHAGLSGNVAVPFEWGSYAIWNLPPGSKVFIDGRFETVYPPEVIRDYFAFRQGSDGWERLLDAWPTEVVVVRRSTGVQARLFQRPDLEYVYSDPAALVFVRKSPRMAPLLEKLRASDRMAFERPEAVFP
ncbi:MAG: hypothetical protein ACKOCT_09180 [Alphaproteobacteria bacterium]